MKGSPVLNEKGQLLQTIGEGTFLFHPSIGLGIVCQTECRHYQLIMVGDYPLSRFRFTANRLNEKRPVSLCKLNTPGGFKKLVSASHTKPEEWSVVNAKLVLLEE